MFRLRQTFRGFRPEALSLLIASISTHASTIRGISVAFVLIVALVAGTDTASAMRPIN